MPDWELVVKMFGSRSNVVLFKDCQAQVLFKQKFIDDLKLNSKQLNRSFIVNEQTLKEMQGTFTKMLPTLGGVVKKQLELQGYWEQNSSLQWEMIEEVLTKLEQPDFYIYLDNSVPRLTMFTPTHYLSRFDSAIDALNEFYQLSMRFHRLSSLKKSSISGLERKIKKAHSTIRKTEQRLQQLENKFGYRQMADLLMAYMHQITPGNSEIVLPHFETGDPVRIKLKSTLSPQKNAESYYRKAKNQQKEVKILRETLHNCTTNLKIFEDHLITIRNYHDPKLLLSYLKDHHLYSEKRVVEQVAPFKEYTVKGYRILIGRNAANNDLLTHRYAHKDDLWLHAKDVKGSHVVIKNIPGQSFSTPVIERAAQLAAYYSKRKNETLCPVIYTEKKFVRKPKGAAAGQVVVDREKTILVAPQA
jgi:predicted ribosome quality control (RQC) complex YloA/Tae2 family protein